MDCRKINRLRSRVLGAIAIALILMAGAFSAYPQNTQEAFATNESNQSTNGNSSFALKRGVNEFGIFSGTSLNTPTIIGTVEDSRLTLVGLRYGRILGTIKRVAFEYTVDVIPVAVVSQPRFVAIPTAPGTFSIQKEHQSVYGVGIAPVGFKFNFRRDKRVQPFSSTSGGFLYFTKQVPAPGSSQFNFTFNFSGGVQILTSSRKAITLGYEFRHISNGGTAQFNPGLDANIIYAEFSIFR